MRTIRASFIDGGSEPCLRDSVRTVVKKGDRSVENFLKNLAGKPSGPGDFPDCIDDTAWAISVWDRGVSNPFATSGDIVEMRSGSRNALIGATPPSH